VGKVTVSEFATAAGEREYILASSANSVEPEELRALFESPGQSDVPVNASSPRSVGGRAAVQYIQYRQATSEADLQLVLRQYRRGGLAAKVSQRTYVWNGLTKTRAATELGLLDYLWQQNLPVCEPFAARVIRQGLRYQCDLITHRISAAETMGSLLCGNGLHAQQWSAVGRIIKRMHDLQIYHADLNAHNIMLQGDTAYLIDFDRGEVRNSGGGQWKASNLQRLHRSVLKLQQQNGFEFNQADWQALQVAYAG